LPNVLTKGNKGYTEDSRYLVERLLFFLVVFSTEMEHFLDFEYIT
jgi:hypothetical protein